MIFDLILYGNDEFKIKNNKIYHVLVVNNEKKEKNMYDIFNKYLASKSFVYMGIDFEFNKVSKTNKDVALMQICLENDKDNVDIVILNPNLISNKNILIELLINDNIYKILHGSESLDIPYIFNQLLVKKEYVDQFCNKFYDTKFLCDYYNASQNINLSCSIYDLLLNQEIITQSKYESLYKIEEDMGPIYLIKIDIKNLSDKVLIYSLYDVLYLPELIKKMLTYGKIYNFTIPQISCLVNKSKRNIETEFNELEKIVKLMNIYYFYYNNKQYRLNDIWLLYYNIIISIDNDIKLLNSINYFKNAIKIITKLIIYLALSNKIIIYKSKNNIFDNNIILKFYKWIEKYSSIYNLFNNYYDDILSDINSW